jgi:hypothetical protein
MSAKKVIAVKNLPAVTPIFKLAVIWLMLDRFKANNYIMGGFYLFAVVSFFIAGYLIFEQKETNIFEEK